MMIGDFMANKVELRARLAFWQDALQKLRKAYLALLDGGVQSYRLDDMEITRLNISTLNKRIEEAEAKVDELTALLEVQRPRRAVGVLPRDW